MTADRICILSLPEEILGKILSSLSYDDISRTRIVCKKFDSCCQRLLNQGFLKVEKFHSHCLRDIKAQLPRRESERRDHPLARHSDILTAIETRLSLLSMTFMKYVDMNLCSFIPGKVIDEIYLVLRNIQSTPTPPRSHEILQELRDISSMAMEHFDEHIVPLLKQKIGATRRTMTLTSNASSMAVISTVPAASCTCASLRRDITKLQLWSKQINSGNTFIRKELNLLKQKNLEDRRKLKELEKFMNEKNHLFTEYTSRMSEQDGKVSELSRKMLECDRHISDIFAELSRSREDCLNDQTQTTISTKGNVANLPTTRTLCEDDNEEEINVNASVDKEAVLKQEILIPEVEIGESSINTRSNNKNKEVILAKKVDKDIASMITPAIADKKNKNNNNSSLKKDKRKLAKSSSSGSEPTKKKIKIEQDK